MSSCVFCDGQGSRECSCGRQTPDQRSDASCSIIRFGQDLSATLRELGDDIRQGLVKPVKKRKDE